MQSIPPKATARSAKVDRRRAPETKARILDAAEALFAKRGYHGTSIRDISSAARVQNAQTYHHFGSKEGLFRAVVERRGKAHSVSIRGSLDDLLAACGNELPLLDQLFRAFMQPMVDRVLRSGPGWRNYIRLLAQLANQPQDESYAAPFGENFDTVVGDYIAQVRRIHPEISAEDTHWSFFFFQSAIIHIVLEAGIVDRQSDGLCRSHDLDLIVDKMARFFSAGVRGMRPDEFSQTS